MTEATKRCRFLPLGFVYDTHADAQAVDELMDQGPPPNMPEDLQEILARGERTYRGVFAVVQSDGDLGSSE